MAVLLHHKGSCLAAMAKIDRQTFLVSLAYSAIGAAITIVARTQYAWDSGVCPALFPLSSVSLAIIFKNSALKINRRDLTLIPGQWGY
jgi:hypothetical protein